MFNTPIKHVRITSLDEWQSFSFFNCEESKEVKIWYNDHENNAIIFTNEHGNIFISPYRPGLVNLLESEGFKEEIYFSAKIPEDDIAYQWLQKIANEECWAYTYEKAFEISKSKNLSPVRTQSYKLKIKQIDPDNGFLDSDLGKIFSSMTYQFLNYNTDKNVGTYIYIDEKTVLLCDEYGRTFLVKSPTVINEFVNDLIAAGYTRTIAPHRYVRDYEGSNIE